MNKMINNKQGGQNSHKRKQVTTRLGSLLKMMKGNPTTEEVKQKKVHVRWKRFNGTEMVPVKNRVEVISFSCVQSIRHLKESRSLQVNFVSLWV